MIRKTSLAFIVIVVILMLAAGCTPKDNTATSAKTPFIGGTIGLFIEYAEQAPPDEVFDGGDFPFDVEVSLENMGETFVAKEDATVKISGIDPAQFGATPADLVKHPDDDLEPTMKDPDGGIIEGTKTFVTFSDLNHAGSLSGNTPFTFRADVCYKYETVVNAKACIKEDILDTDPDDICIVSEAKKAYNSGAPVAVVDFREQAGGRDKVYYIFTIRHVGGGEIFKLGLNCDESSRSNKDRVYVTVDSGIPGLSCSGLSNGDATSGYATLHDEKRTIRCTQPLEERSGDYEKVVVITLGYDYREDIATEVLVKHSTD